MIFLEEDKILVLLTVFEKKAITIHETKLNLV